MAMQENYDDVMGQLRQFDLIVDHLKVGTAKPIRCFVIDGGKEKRGWYWLSELYLDNKSLLVGSFGVYRGNDSNKQKIVLDKSHKITAEQKQAMDARHKENIKRAEGIRKAEAEKAALRAGTAWRSYQPTGACDYLDKKNVKAHGVRFHPTAGTMMVPMMDEKARVWGVQLIRGSQAQKGKIAKQYWPAGLDKKGKYHLIGSPLNVILVAEGYATAATLHEATGLPVAVAFDAGNLMPVCQNLHKTYPRAKIIVCADDDYLTDGNPGVTAAQVAALSVGGLWIKPTFPVDEQGLDARNGQKLTDFNDLANLPQGGLHLVRAQIDSALAGQMLSVKPQPIAAVPTKGAGEARPVALSTMPLDDLVTRFMFIDDETGDYVYDTWTQAIAKYTKVVKLLPAGLKTEDVKRHPTWLSRAVYIDQIGFDPTEKDTNIKCNRWNGWPTQPNLAAQYKDCENLLSLLFYLCGSEAIALSDNQIDDTNQVTLYKWLLNWMAYPIQHPGAKMQSAVVMHGPQGTGKSLFWETYAKIYGEYATVLNQGAIEDKFNSDWSERKLFIVADEIVARAEMHHMKNQLKGMITGEWIRVNPKNVAAHKERNHINMVFLSNEHQPVVLENDDRRHCVVWTPKKLGEAFYQDVNAEIENGGIAALHQYLLNHDLGDFKPWTKPPSTKAKDDLIQTNLDSPQIFINDYLSGDLGTPVGPVKSSDFYNAYQAWCKVNGEKFPRATKQFMPYIKNLGWEVGHKDCYDSYHWTNKKRTRVLIPDAAAMAKAQAAGVPTILHDPSQTLSQYVTTGVLSFINALKGDQNAY